jgi:heptosyltransferase I
MTILIVRLGALGDIVHTIPAAAALRHGFPAARIHWAVDARHAPFVELVTAVDHVVPLEGRRVADWVRLVRNLRRHHYDWAFDFQGLRKSAALARASGARRVIGFPSQHLREKIARRFYSEVASAEGGGHVIRKNLGLLRTVGVSCDAIEFPIAGMPSAARDEVRRDAAGRGIALINAGAAWPNKRWPAARYGEVGAFLRDACGMQPYVVWGPAEETLARDVVAASHGAARLAPPTSTRDLLELARAASLMVSGDTGPLHIAAAAGTPLVGIFGPTDPARNGPWSGADVIVSRYAACRCHYERRCRTASWCLLDVPASEVTAAIRQRLAAARQP